MDGGINTYGYAYQNPVRYIDPEGLVPVSAVCLLPGTNAVCAAAASKALNAIIAVGFAAYELCSDDDAEEERCRKVKNECIEKCSDFGLPSSDGTGTSFRRCIRTCMAKKGCFNF